MKIRHGYETRLRVVISLLELPQRPRLRGTHLGSGTLLNQAASVALQLMNKIANSERDLTALESRETELKSSIATSHGERLDAVCFIL